MQQKVEGCLLSECVCVLVDSLYTSVHKCVWLCVESELSTSYHSLHTCRGLDCDRGLSVCLCEWVCVCGVCVFGKLLMRFKRFVVGFLRFFYIFFFGLFMFGLAGFYAKAQMVAYFWGHMLPSD